MIEENVNPSTPEIGPKPDYDDRLKSARETAAKHGYYWSVLSDDEKIEYELALSRDDFEQEIALVVSKLKCMLPAFAYNLSLLPKMLGVLERLAKTQRLVFKKEDTSPLEQAVEKVLSRLQLPPALTGLPGRSSPPGLPDQKY